MERDQSSLLFNRQPLIFYYPALQNVLSIYLSSCTGNCLIDRLYSSTDDLLSTLSTAQAH